MANSSSGKLWTVFVYFLCFSLWTVVYESVWCSVVVLCFGLTTHRSVSWERECSIPVCDTRWRLSQCYSVRSGLNRKSAALKLRNTDVIPNDYKYSTDFRLNNKTTTERVQVGLGETQDNNNTNEREEASWWVLERRLNSTDWNEHRVRSWTGKKHMFFTQREGKTRSCTNKAGREGKGRAGKRNVTTKQLNSTWNYV